jgi:hypothetical protein
LFDSFGSNGSGDPAGDQSVMLIDGLDDIALDQSQGGYRARHAQPDRDVVGVDEPTEAAGDAVEPPTGVAVAETGDGWVEPEDFRFAVRPYTWTRGRTRAAQDLAVETLVSTSDAGRDVTTIHSAEHTAIARLCVHVRSVAEIAALLALPLGVVRVLLADMIDNGLMRAHRNPTASGSPPDLSLMKRVLAGLHRL